MPEPDMSPFTKIALPRKQYTEEKLTFSSYLAFTCHDWFMIDL